MTKALTVDTEHLDILHIVGSGVDTQECTVVI